MQQPTVGRIVHIFTVANVPPQPGIVTKVLATNRVHVTVFDIGQEVYRQDLRSAEEAKESGQVYPHWDWPQMAQMKGGGVTCGARTRPWVTARAHCTTA